MRSLFKYVVSGLVLLTILGTGVSLAQEYDAEADADVTYAATDAADGFYTVDVPEGWTLDGGSDSVFGSPIPVFMLTSPDETSQIMSGLFDKRVYVEPNDQYAEGETVTIGSETAEVRPYVAAVDYYSGYIEGNLITFDDCTEEPTVTAEPVETPPDMAAQFPGEFDAVSVYYACPSTDGYVDVADIYLRLYREEMADIGSVWMVDAYVAYITPESEQPLVYAITEHVVTTVAVNQEWVLDNTLDEYSDAMAYAIEATGLLTGIYANR